MQEMEKAFCFTQQEERHVHSRLTDVVVRINMIHSRTSATFVQQLMFRDRTVFLHHLLQSPRVMNQRTSFIFSGLSAPGRFLCRIQLRQPIASRRKPKILNPVDAREVDTTLDPA